MTKTSNLPVPLVFLDLLVLKDDLDRLVPLVRKVAVVLTVNFV